MSIKSDFFFYECKLRKAKSGLMYQVVKFKFLLNYIQKYQEYLSLIINIIIFLSIRQIKKKKNL